MRTKTSATYYKTNDYANVTKVYEEYIGFRTGSNHKKRRKTKKKTRFPKKYVENTDL